METSRPRPLTWEEARRRWDDPSVGDPPLPGPRYPRPHGVRLHPHRGLTARETDSHIPDGVRVTFPPRGVEDIWRRELPPLQTRGVPPGVIFLPEDRRAFRDRNYPWRTIGRVESGMGKGTGFVVGPRHVMTASHMVQWGREGNPGWVRFLAGYNKGFVDSGMGELFIHETFAEQTYFYRQVDGNVASLTQGDSAWDFVVCVMDRRIGEEVGWIGTRTYDDDWDDTDYWQNVGYPLDVGGTEYPVFQQRPFRVLDEYDGGDVDDGNLLRAEGDFNFGQSGSPVFAMFEDGPHAVGLFSGGGTYPSLSDDQGNFLPAGSHFVHIVNQARSDFP
jgi:V8-like Glu-specific endopeptidase